ncbi:zinc-binding dehydrogenase family protein [Mycobacteroides abscessus subsp. bolletii 1513]|uniref:Zinc-binding dehydrogenase family protein n=1 Tax=Mycobacteroides abscessus subsp. bolletii 1513 TaxID=1299321 RepID=X8E0K2_9MYCO|nr:zinc-binding dehydrogenase family protein [Mycobacteroides abscessus subsp. bolletii 1513]
MVDRNSVVVIDENVPLDTAALFGCAMLTGFGAVTHTASVRPGDSVAVLGLGGVGLAVVMSAAAAGAGEVLAIDPVPAKRELALELGATSACAPDEAPADTTGCSRWSARPPCWSRPTRSPGAAAAPCRWAYRIPMHESACPR